MTVVLLGTSNASPEEAQAAFTSGQSRMRANDLVGAQTDFELAVEKSPDNTQYLSDLGMVYLRTGQAKAAAKTYERMCSITESEFGALSSRIFGCHTLWGNALLMSQDVRGAAEKFRSAHTAAMAQTPRIVSDCLMSLYSLTYTLNSLGRLAEAEQLYEKLLSETPESSRYQPQVKAALQAVREGKLPPRLQ